MFYSAIGFLLTLFMAFTIIPLLAFLLRMISILLFTRIYWGFTKDRSPVNLLQFSIKLAQPLGFATAIFHGYAALWMGVVFFKGLELAVDWFLPASLGMAFIWFGLIRIKKPADVEVKSNIKKGKDGQDILVLNPEVNSTPDDDEDQMTSFNKEMQERLKENTKEFMQGNTIISLIGRVTGVAMAAAQLISF